MSFPRPVPRIGDPTSAAERATAPDAWALRDDIASLERVVGARRDIRRFRPDPVPDEVPDDPYAAQLSTYLARTAGAFAGAQSSRDAAVAIADAALSSEYRFRWQTSEGATAFVGLSLADTDGSRVLGATRGWVETAPN